MMNNDDMDATTKVDHDQDHSMDTTTCDDVGSTTARNGTTMSDDTATVPMNPLLESKSNMDRINIETRIQTQQQQAQNLDTWLQLIETAVRPFLPPNPVQLNDMIHRRCHQRRSPQYTIEQGILSSHYSNNGPTDVVGSSLVKKLVSHTTIENNNNTVNESAVSSLSSMSSTETTASTVLLTTVTLHVGQPSVIAPKQGDIVVTVVNNTAMGTNNSTSHLIQTIQSKLQRVLEENMDLEQLSIIERKIAYRLVVTVTILFVESIASITLFDACLVAAIAALIDTRIPTQPIINDGVLYTTTTTSMSKIGTGRNNAENDISITDAAARETCSDTKSLHMPIIPISITALGVRLPKSTAVMGSTNHDNNESAAAAKAAAKPTSSDVLQWLVDPTTDEQQQISDATIATIVINAAAIPNTTTMDDLNKELDQNKEDILCLQLNPHAATKTSSHVAATTSTVTTTTGVSWVDLENVIAIARRHVKSMYKLIKPK